MTSRWARVARGWFTASLAVFVAAFSHVVAGGETPGVLGAALALVFATLASIALAGRRLSWPRLIASVGVSQFLLHFLFSLGAGPAVVTSSGAHHGAVSFAASTPAGSGHAAHDGSAMWFAHAIAALVAIALVRYSESTLNAVSAFASPWIEVTRFFALAPVSLSHLRVRIVAALTDESTSTWRPLGSVSRRGPPALAAA